MVNNLKMNYEQITSNYLEWMENKNDKGKYTGNANHAIWGAENTNQFPHSFHYYGIILGYLNLFQTLKNKVFLEKAEEAANYLCKLQKSSGQYKFDSFQHNIDHNTGYTVIHNSLPSIALFKLSKATNNQKYFKTAKKNTLWLISKLKRINYLTKCINQDMTAAEALTQLYSIEKKASYLKIINHICNFCKKYQTKKGSFIRSPKEHIEVPWYNSRTATAFYNISLTLNKKQYFDIAKTTAKYLKQQIKKQGLIHWYNNNKKLEKPYLIAPIGSVFYLLDKCSVKFDDSILKKQNPDGSFPNADGYKDQRDKTPTLGWSQFTFLYLSTKVAKPIPKPKTKQFNIKETPTKLKSSITIKLKNGNSGYAFFRKDLLISYSKKLNTNIFKIPKEEGELQLVIDNHIPKRIKITKDQTILEVQLEKPNLFYKFKRLLNN